MPQSNEEVVNELKQGIVTFVTMMIQELRRTLPMKEAVMTTTGWTRQMLLQMERAIEEESQNIPIPNEETSNDQ